MCVYVCVCMYVCSGGKGGGHWGNTLLFMCQSVGQSVGWIGLGFAGLNRVLMCWVGLGWVGAEAEAG